MNSATLTPSDVRRLFAYEDGRLLWREDHSARARGGSSAGHLQASTGTVVLSCRGTTTTRARMVYAWHYGKWPSGRVWHRNHDPADDHVENLVDLTEHELRLVRRDPISDAHLPGVVQNHDKWAARCNGQYIGTFATPEEAHEAYKAAHAETFPSLSKFAPGGVNMSFASEAATAPPEIQISALGISAPNFTEGLSNGPM